MSEQNRMDAGSHHFALSLTRGMPALILFYCAPALAYYALVTGFDFDFFKPEFAWNAYNQYLLSMLDGRLDIPPEVIGKEGLYVDGKAYIYYGAFPVIIRLLAYPFVDLDVTPIARLSIWILSVSAVSVLQWRLLTTFRTITVEGAMELKFALLCFASLILWFASAHTVIVQSAEIKHEPFAASLLLVAVYLAVVSGDLMFTTGERRYRLVIYAVIAALSLYTRPTIAISLYAATLFLIGAAVYEEATSGAITNKKWLVRYWRVSAYRGLVPLLIMGGGGALLLLMNYSRFGDPFSMAGGTYGFYATSELSTELLCSRTLDHGRFEYFRIIPNTIYYLFGGYDIHTKISIFLDSGFVRREPPKVRMALLWPIGIVAAVIFVRTTFPSAFKRDARAIVLSGIFLALMTGVLLMLAYTTITYRYMADLWAPMEMGILFSWYYISKRLDGMTASSIKYLAVGTVGLFMTLELIFTYSMSSYAGYRGHFPAVGNFFEGSNNLALRNYLAGIKTPESRPWDPSDCEQYDWWQKK